MRKRRYPKKGVRIEKEMGYRLEEKEVSGQKRKKEKRGIKCGMK